MLTSKPLHYIRRINKALLYIENHLEDEIRIADLGAFSISLAVKDIAASKAFYETLGFAPLEGAGSIDQKWMILKQGNTKIGLFQGMFPSNTLTFNPTNARPIHKVLENNEVEMVYEMGLETESGPCSFSFLDPGGNAILVDQHKP